MGGFDEDFAGFAVEEGQGGVGEGEVEGEGVEEFLGDVAEVDGVVEEAGDFAEEFDFVEVAVRH